MLSEKIEKVLNRQIQSELYSSYFYLAMVAYAQQIGLSGLSHWMHLQSTEETGHAMKLFEYVNDRGGRVVLEAIPQPPSKFKSPQDMFGQALQHEQEVTQGIHELYQMAKNEGDHATEVQMQWFIQEQVEEEKTFSEIAERLKMIGDQPASLFIIDRELRARQDHTGE